jgi:hypothetical protein
MAKQQTKKSSAPEPKVEEVKAEGENAFKAKVNGKEKTFVITQPFVKFRKERYTAAEAAANPDVCERLIKMEAKNIREVFPEVKSNSQNNSKPKDK